MGITSSQVRHCVLMKFASTTPTATKVQIFERLQALRQDPALHIVDMVSGPSSAAPAGPTGLDRGYTDALVVTLPSLAARDVHGADPRHQTIVADIVANLEGGINGLIRFDFQTN
jgi:hypothetical protein